MPIYDPIAARSLLFPSQKHFLLGHPTLPFSPIQISKTSPVAKYVVNNFNYTQGFNIQHYKRNLPQVFSRCPVSVYFPTFSHNVETKVYDLYHAARKAKGGERIHGEQKQLGLGSAVSLISCLYALRSA